GAWSWSRAPGGGAHARQAPGTCVTATTTNQPATASPAAIGIAPSPRSPIQAPTAGPPAIAYAIATVAASRSKVRCRRLGGTAVAPAQPHDPASGCVRNT